MEGDGEEIVQVAEGWRLLSGTVRQERWDCEALIRRPRDPFHDGQNEGGCFCRRALASEPISRTE
jgi:hypothetical protein